MLSTPITKTIIPKKSPGSAVVSNSFMNALSAGSANAVELQKKRKKPPPVIDLPLNSPLEPVTVTTPGATVPPSTVPESDPNGPNPARVPIPGSKRRIHFADDKGEELVLIKYIENVLLNKTHRPSSDMKHADAEAERISMKQRKTDVEEEDDEDMQIEMQSSGNNDIADWQPIAYCDPDVKEFCSELVEEENIREGSAMRSFIPQPDGTTKHSCRFCC
uniref:Uncharacterized protein n=1 Tax=Panagrolaimus superbus TaxID=310955 RepID=A0A914Y5H1_9BILA